MSKLRQVRKVWISCVAMVMFGCLGEAGAQTSYSVEDLGVLNDWNMSCAMALNNHGWTLSMNAEMDPISNFIQAVPLTGHAAVNVGGIKIDLGTLGGQNSWMNWGGINDSGQAVGMAETSQQDPDGEDVCGFGTGKICRPFLWQNNQMSSLPTLGGNNGQASDINDSGVVAGTAQTNNVNQACLPEVRQTMVPVLWVEGVTQTLPLIGNETDGSAMAINKMGEATGWSGVCNAAYNGVFWKDKMAYPLPDYGTGAIGQGINIEGEIAGIVGSSDNTTEYAAVWQDLKLTTLGTLPGDFASIASGINNQGQVVGSTLDSGFNWSRAFIWQNNVMTDLNSLIPSSANLYATMANKINDRGQISGMATVVSGPHANEVHAFLATPINASVGTSIAQVVTTHPPSNLPHGFNQQNVRRLGPWRSKP